MIGLGAKDDGPLAADFVTSTGTYSFPMYWDETFESWVSFDVVSQPAAVLLSPEGAEIGRWQGRFSFDDVLAASTG